MHLSYQALPRVFLLEAKQNNKHTSGLVHRVLFYSDSPVFNLTLNPFYPLTNGWPVLRCVTTRVKARKMEGKKKLVGRFRVDRFTLFLEGSYLFFLALSIPAVFRTPEEAVSVVLEMTKSNFTDMECIPLQIHIIPEAICSILNIGCVSLLPYSRARFCIFVSRSESSS